MPGSEGWARTLTLQRKQTTRTETADSFFRSQNLERIDFLKLDAQGAELRILKGARDYLSSGKIAVIKTEVSFLPVYRGQCTFSDIDRFLKEQGFLFVDCAFYPDAVGWESSPTAIRGVSLREQIRFSAGGDAFYALDPNRYSGDDRTGCTVRAGHLNQLGYVSVAFDILHGARSRLTRSKRYSARRRASDPRSSLEASAERLLAPFRLSGTSAAQQPIALQELTCASALVRTSAVEWR